MSTIKSSDEHLTLNADGTSKDIKFQANGVEKASISSAGAFTSTTIDATKLTGDLPAISGANLTGVGVAGITSSADATAMTIDSNEHIGIGIAPKIIAGGSRYLTVGTQTAGQAGFLELVGNRTANAGQDTAIMKFINNTTEIAEIGAYDNGSTNGGDLKFRTSSGGTASTQLEITSDGDVDLVDKLILGKIGSTYTSGEGHSITSWAGDVNSSVYLQARNVADSSNIMFVDVNANTKIKFTAAGNGYWDGVGDAGAADYAEYFEWADGNPSNEDRVGMSVSMVGNKIKIAEDGDVVMGIVSARPAFVGDSASLGWQGKWETDVYGRRVQQDITVYSWEEVVENEDGKLVTKKQEYRHDKIPEGVTVPDDATSVVRQEDKLSAEYDADADYVPRSNRKEWSAIGLMGKLKLRTGQVTDSRWIKMRDMSDTIEEWLVR